MYYLLMKIYKVIKDNQISYFIYLIIFYLLFTQNDIFPWFSRWDPFAILVFDQINFNSSFNVDFVLHPGYGFYSLNKIILFLLQFLGLSHIYDIVDIKNCSFGFYCISQFANKLIYLNQAIIILTIFFMDLALKNIVRVRIIRYLLLLNFSFGLALLSNLQIVTTEAYGIFFIAIALYIFSSIKENNFQNALIKLIFTFILIFFSIFTKLFFFISLFLFSFFFLHSKELISNIEISKNIKKLTQFSYPILFVIIFLLISLTEFNFEKTQVHKLHSINIIYISFLIPFLITSLMSVVDIKNLIIISIYKLFYIFQISFLIFFVIALAIDPITFIKSVKVVFSIKSETALSTSSMVLLNFLHQSIFHGLGYFILIIIILINSYKELLKKNFYRVFLIFLYLFLYIASLYILRPIFRDQVIFELHSFIFILITYISFKNFSNRILKKTFLFLLILLNINNFLNFTHLNKVIKVDSFSYGYNPYKFFDDNYGGHSSNILQYITNSSPNFNQFSSNKNLVKDYDKIIPSFKYFLPNCRIDIENISIFSDHASHSTQKDYKLAQYEPSLANSFAYIINNKICSIKYPYLNFHYISGAGYIWEHKIHNKINIPDNSAIKSIYNFFSQSLKNSFINFFTNNSHENIHLIPDSLNNYYIGIEKKNINQFKLNSNYFNFKDDFVGTATYINDDKNLLEYDLFIIRNYTKIEELKNDYDLLILMSE